MNKMSLRSVSVIWALLLLTSKMNYALILRLHCKEVAEFNIVKTGFILEGSVIDTFPALDVEACKTKCVENNKCASINIEISTGQCQLNSKTIDDNRFKQTMFLKKQNGWSFITTDFGDPLIGENCKILKPCLIGELCTDSCDCPGYQCHQCPQNRTGLHCQPGWKDCSDVKKSGNVKNGIYTIKATPEANLSVFCDLSTDNTGWIVIQRRVDGTTNFDRNWAEYKKGFGDINGNYWMGLDNMHLLAMPGRGAKLRIDMKHKDNPTEIFYAQYEKFEIASEAEKYRLSVGGYSGTAGDSLIQCTGNFRYGCSNGMMFTTKDNDNDEASFNCAVRCPGGWWFKQCFNGNLNLLYNQQGSSPQYMSWFTLRSSFGGLIYSEMKIKYQ